MIFDWTINVGHVALALGAIAAGARWAFGVHRDVGDLKKDVAAIRAALTSSQPWRASE